MYRIKASLKYLLIVLLFIYLAQGCKTIDPPAVVPTYIHIDSFRVVRTPNLVSTGPGPYSTTHSITTVWAFYNNNPIGTFDLPATFPVITTDSGQLELEPGIDMDGLNDFLVAYPFYQIDTFSFVPKPGQIITHIPVTSYQSYTVINVLVNFSQNIGTLFGGWGNWGNANIRGYDGFGLIALNKSTQDTLSVDTSNWFTIAYDSFSTNPAYIELDYKNTAPFAIGIKGNLNIGGSTTFDTLTLINLYPTNTWQHIYLQLTDFVAEYKATTYNLYIKAALGPGDNTDTVLLNNIQLVTY